MVLVFIACVALYGISLFAGAQAGSVPQSPHDLTDVALIKNGEFLHPYIPNVGTSYDGRIGLNRNETIFYLMTPETVTSPVMNVASPNGVDRGTFSRHKPLRRFKRTL